MKRLCLLIPIIFSYAVLNAQTPSKNAEADFKTLVWLEGTWSRTNAKPGRTGMEVWKRSGEFELVGRGITLKGADTSFVEKIKIIIKDHTLFYVADVPENKSAVYFKFTELTSNSFACENPSHDFPKKIAYKLEGNKLTAVISGGGKSIPYTFERK